MIKTARFSLALAGVFTAATALAANLPLTPKVEYSADQTLETAEATMTGKVYVTPTKERREMNVSGQTMSMIIRRDKKLGWTLMPSEKMYMEMSFDQVLSQQPENPDNYKIETTAMGSETINGVATEKTKVVMTNKQDGSKMSGFWWITKDSIVMKMDVKAEQRGESGRVKLTLSNLKIGKQNASLFEIPAGYSKMTMPSMQNIQDMMRAAEQDSANDEEAPKGKSGFNFNDALKMIR